MSAWTFPVILRDDGSIAGHRIERGGALAGLIVFRPTGEVVFILSTAQGEAQGATVSQVDAGIRAAFAALSEGSTLAAKSSG